jgi:tetratricopeptide (TPR) repeat protein
MFHNVISVWLLLTTNLSRQERSLFSSPLSVENTLEVCLSPGCLADGGKSTLEKLQSLAPPGLIVIPGLCCSLCGNGPVVMDQNNNKKFRRISGQKLLDLLFEEQEMNFQQKAIVGGYDLITQADDMVATKNYQEAVRLYEEATSLAFQPAKELQAARDDEIGVSEFPTVPSGLIWLINAKQREATSRMNMGDMDGAIEAAKLACELSQNASPEAFEVLHEMYQSKGDASGELSALRALFGLPPEPQKPSTTVANKRRTLGFRLAKLEREQLSN